MKLKKFKIDLDFKEMKSIAKKEQISKAIYKCVCKIKKSRKTFASAH
jgi:hypothetical protein